MGPTLALRIRRNQFSFSAADKVWGEVLFMAAESGGFVLLLQCFACAAYLLARYFLPILLSSPLAKRRIFSW
jgi:hypothetical protein